MSTKTAQIAAQEVHLEVVTDADHRGAPVTFRALPGTMQVWYGGEHHATFGRDTLRDWLRHPAGALEGATAPEHHPVTLTLLGFRDIALTLQGVTEWLLSPAERQALHEASRPS